jgi:predicted phage terminase large subunit-like protein
MTRSRAPDADRGPAGARSGAGQLPPGEVAGKRASVPQSWDAVALELARRRPEAYAFVAHGLRPARHHRAWLEAIRETVTTPGGRLLLVAPPGSGKSAYASLVLPLWYLGRHPDRAVLAVTSSDVMASEFHGVVALALLANEARRAVFPDPAQRPDPARGWSSDGLYLAGVPPETKDPSYRSSGIGASVIGSRCHLLVLDDPVTQEMAQSEAEMRRVRRYLDQTLLTRLHPGGSAVAVMTRFSDADVAAHLQAQGWRTEVWPQLSVDYPGPARDAEGRVPLWPARFPLEWVAAEQARLGTAQFALLHQGSVLELGGDIFRAASWFRPLPETYLATIAPGAVRMTFVDTAFSDTASADYTAAVTLAYDPRDVQRRTYLTALFRKQVNEDGLARALAEHLLVVRPHAVGVEIPAFRQEAVGGLVLQLRQRLLGRLAVDVQGVPVSSDKVVRARLPAARAEAGLLCVDKALPLWGAMERELLAFPLAAHDDCVDALSGAMVMCLGATAGRVRAAPTPARFG